MNSANRNTRRKVLAVLAALGLPRDAFAQDPAASDPRSFRVVLDNDRVRVLEYKSGPGLSLCGAGMHYHPERVTVSLTGAKVRITDAHGRAAVRDIPPGHVFFSPAETHATEDIGGFGARTYIIELKGEGWKPSTGAV
jgi:beta-alanine degradation protein BauB